MKSLANSVEVMVSWVGMKIPCLDNLSMMTRMEVNLEDGGSCLMKSMEMESHGLSGTGSCFRRP